MCATELFDIDASVLNRKTSLQGTHQETKTNLPKPTIHKNLETITTLVFNLLKFF